MLDPGSSREKPDGTIVQTMWGELAWQLGGAEGYSLVARADEARTSPGERLIELLERYSPCLILIDEWVAYARQLYGRDDLPGGSFDTQMTFAQALSDAAKGVKDAMLVVSIPASDIEVGGEAGKAALERLSNVIFRQEASWKPASAEEGFEIVRRRLFDDAPAELARERDAVVNAFGDLYQKHAAEFPLDAREGGYRRRLQAAYPIHPELFDQLFENWSTLEKFQRTRGVLRLMAAVIHELWARDDAGLLIMPASIPIDAPAVQAELTRYLEEGWTPVIEADVDGPNALPRQLDLENPNLKRYSATRRVARTVYMGSAPTLHQTNRGIDDRSIKLGCVQPGESPAIFGDALRRLSTRAMYLVEDHGQYWYALGQTISRTAEDRKQSRFLEEHADEEIRRRLLAVRERGSFAGVHWAPRGPAEVPDEDEARLVVLGPDHPHASGTEVTAARAMVDAILAERAAGPRVNRNMLAFVAPDKARLEELRDAARSFLAWQSVVDDHEELNLDAQQRRHAETQQRHFDETVDPTDRRDVRLAADAAAGSRQARGDLGADTRDGAGADPGARLPQAHARGRTDHRVLGRAAADGPRPRAALAKRPRRRPRSCGRTTRSTCTCRGCVIGPCFCARSSRASARCHGSRTRSRTPTPTTRRDDDTGGSSRASTRTRYWTASSVVVKPEAARRQLDTELGS